MFEIFGQFFKKNASNTQKAMIRWAKDQTLNIVKYSSTAFLKSGDSLTDWLCDMKSDYTPVTNWPCTALVKCTYDTCMYTQKNSTGVQ